MKLEFTLDGQPAVFERNGSTGRTVIQYGEQSISLQSPWNPLTHIEVRTTKSWTTRLKGHEIVVVKERKRTFGGLRGADFVVRVDGNQVASGTGY